MHLDLCRSLFLVILHMTEFDILVPHSSAIVISWYPRLWSVRTIGTDLRDAFTPASGLLFLQCYLALQSNRRLPIVPENPGYLIFTLHSSIKALAQ